MRRVIFGCFVLAIAAFALYGFNAAQGGKVTAKQLRSTLSQLGYEVKDLNTEVGAEKYEVKVTREGYDVFVAYEISPSTNYVWLTVLLGDAPSESKALAMLKENGKVQPTNFYVTSTGRLMLGLAIDNKAVDNTMLRQKTDKIVGDVVTSATLWSK
jgi:hypothetical protein